MNAKYPYRIRCSKMRGPHQVAASEREAVAAVRVWNRECDGEHWRESILPEAFAASWDREWPGGPVDYFYDPNHPRRVLPPVPMRETP